MSSTDTVSWNAVSKELVTTVINPVSHQGTIHSTLIIKCMFLSYNLITFIRWNKWENYSLLYKYAGYSMQMFPPYYLAKPNQMPCDQGQTNCWIWLWLVLLLCLRVDKKLIHHQSPTLESCGWQFWADPLPSPCNNMQQFLLWTQYCSNLHFSVSVAFTINPLLLGNTCMQKNNYRSIMVITGYEFSFQACYFPVGFGGSAEAAAGEACLSRYDAMYQFWRFSGIKEAGIKP